jgi:predicted enzyme related to lactoylglutathione lyase
MTTPHKTPLNYVEFTSPKLEETQSFFGDVFGWNFIDYGPDYRDIQGAGTGGGIERGDARPPLPVVHADDLEEIYARIKSAGVEITQEIFEFPGGRRFQFREPGGTEMAVWSTT